MPFTPSLIIASDHSVLFGRNHSIDTSSRIVGVDIGVPIAARVLIWPPELNWVSFSQDGIRYC